MRRTPSPSAEHLDLKNAVHIGHSTGGGEVARYVAKHGQPAGRVAKAVLVSAVPPIMLKTASNPEGLPLEVFDGFRKATAENRAQFFLDVPTGPFYGFNRPGAKVFPGVIQKWWRQGMMGSAKAHDDGIKAFSETDQTTDLQTITVPTLVMHGDDDQIVPIADSAMKSVKLLKKWHPQGLQGLLARHADHQCGCAERGPARVHPGQGLTAPGSGDGRRAAAVLLPVASPVGTTREGPAMFPTRNTLPFPPGGFCRDPQSPSVGGDRSPRADQAGHWNVVGPGFIAVHELFDAIAGLVEEQSDLIAERARALGGTAHGTVQVRCSTTASGAYGPGVARHQDAPLRRRGSTGGLRAVGPRGQSTPLRRQVTRRRRTSSPRSAGSVEAACGSSSPT